MGEANEVGFVFCVKRICWIAAWGVWLWLGFGLYLELTRELGRVVRTLPPGDDCRIIRFLAGQPLLVVSEFEKENDRYVLQLFDARTGNLVRTSTFPDGEDVGERYSPTNEFVVTEHAVVQKD